jgi:hypothetical protein
MKNLLLVCLIILFATPVYAERIKRITAPKNVEKHQTLGNISDIPPAKIAEIQRYKNKSIDDMVEKMSDKELKKYIKAMNKAEIESAKQSGRKIPPLLDENTLNDKEKIKEYLRSTYKYTY